MTTTKNIPGLDKLGKAYDVFGRFAHPHGVVDKTPFAKVTKAGVWGEMEDQVVLWGEGHNETYSRPETVDYLTSAVREIEWASGESVSEYSSSLSIQTGLEGSYKYYSGEVDFAFSEDQQTTETYQYTTLNDTVEMYRLGFGNQRPLRKYLKSQAKNDIDGEMSPEDLFDTYGTHFLREVTVGGLVRYSATMESSTSYSDIDVESSLKASYNSIVGYARFNVDAQYSSSQYQSKIASKTSIEVIGGTVTEVEIAGGGEAKFDEYIESIPDNPELVAFTDESLVPMWELAKDESRRDEIRDTFDDMASKSTEMAGQAGGCRDHPTAMGQDQRLESFRIAAHHGKGRRRQRLDAALHLSGRGEQLRDRLDRYGEIRIRLQGRHESGMAFRRSELLARASQEQEGEQDFVQRNQGV